MTKREALRAAYIAGWYEKDIAKLMRSTRADYRFDDPAEPAQVPKDGLEAYSRRWDARTGGKNDWVLDHKVRQDSNGVLTDWLRWHVSGTELSGAAVVLTSDEGVFLERVADFRR